MEELALPSPRADAAAAPARTPTPTPPPTTRSMSPFSVNSQLSYDEYPFSSANAAGFPAGASTFSVSSTAHAGSSGYYDAPETEDASRASIHCASVSTAAAATITTSTSSSSSSSSTTTSPSPSPSTGPPAAPAPAPPPAAPAPSPPADPRGPKPLAALSAALRGAGFPELPRAILTAEAAAGLNVVLGVPQLEELAGSVTRVLAEYHRRGKLVQRLTEQEAQARSRVEEESMRREDALRDRIRELQAQLLAAEDAASSLRLSLQQAQEEAARLSDHCEALNRRQARHQEETNALRRELSVATHRAQAEQLQAERTFEQVTREYFRHQRRDPGRAPIDRLTCEVIRVYEQKLSELGLKLDEALKERDSARLEEASVESEGPPEDGSRRLRLIDDVNDRTASVAAKNRSLVAELNVMRARLAEATEKLASAEESNEILSLRLLSRKTDAQQARCEPGAEPLRLRGHADTLDMIKRDKLTHKYRLWRVDNLDPESCRNCLKDILVKLRVVDVDYLLSVVDDTVRVIRMVPQMQEHITAVDRLFWEGMDDTGKAFRSPSAGPVKLSETLRRMTEWTDEAVRARKFRAAVRDLVRSSGNGRTRRGARATSAAKSDDECLAELRRLVPRARAAEARDAAVSGPHARRTADDDGSGRSNEEEDDVSDGARERRTGEGREIFGGRMSIGTLRNRVAAQRESRAK